MLKIKWTTESQNYGVYLLGPKKYQKIVRMYDCTGPSTKCTLIKTGFKNLRTGTEAKFRPCVDAIFLGLILSTQNRTHNVEG